MSIAENSAATSHFNSVTCWGDVRQNLTIWKISEKLWKKKKKLSFITEMFVCILTDEAIFRHFEVIIVVILGKNSNMSLPPTFHDISRPLNEVLTLFSL